MSAFTKIAGLVATAQQVQAIRRLENVCFSDEPRDMGDKNVAALISVIVFIVVIFAITIYAQYTEPINKCFSKCKSNKKASQPTN
jgi:hypothetical protein